MSEEAQADCDRILDTAVPFAQQMLETYGEFYPYALKLLDNGTTEGLTAKPGQDEWPKSEDVLRNLYQRLTAQSATLRAVAVVADVLLTTDANPIDAVKVEIEHREGVAIAVLIPYEKQQDGKNPQFGAPRAALGERRVWPASS